MIFLTLTILNVFKKNQIVLKTQTIHHAYNLFFTDCPIYLQNTSTIETGIFDFHKLVVLVLKMLYEKPKIIYYRNYKAFTEQLFRIEMEKELGKIDFNNTQLAEFHDDFLSLINKHAPVKLKYLLIDNSSHMTISLR